MTLVIFFYGSPFFIWVPGAAFQNHPIKEEMRFSSASSGGGGRKAQERRDIKRIWGEGVCLTSWLSVVVLLLNKMLVWTMITFLMAKYLPFGGFVVSGMEI